jgi:hypothetical protein
MFNLAFYLLNHAFHLELSIPSQLARFALGASCHFVDCSLNLIFVHRSTSVESICENSIEALEYRSGASALLTIRARIIAV